METVVQGDYPLDASNYPEVDQAFTELGISFSDFIQQLNIGESGILKNSSDNSSAGLLVTAFSVPITTLFQVSYIYLCFPALLREYGIECYLELRCCAGPWFFVSCPTGPIRE